MTRDELEAKSCTCGADGSGEQHEDWCIWLTTEPMFDALNACERYALRIVGHDAGHQFDRNNASGIIRAAKIGRGEPTD